MISIDNETIFKIIKSRNPSSVAINGPEGLISKIQETANKITEQFKIPVFIIGDTCWGSCDLNTHAADILGVDILFNIGHTISMDTFGQKVVMINAFDDINFDKIAKKCATELKNQLKNISVLTNSQHLHQLQNVKNIFIENGFNVISGSGKGQLNESQVFGCEFYPAYETQNMIEAYIFLGQSMFHSLSIAMVTDKPTYMLDPYYEEYSLVNETAKKFEKRAILGIYNALDAETIGIIIGLKEGQFAKIKALDFKKMLEKLGKKVQLIALTDITEDRINNFKGIDAFIQVACPRISTDNHFKKPVLSVPQASALIKLIKKEPIDEFLKLRHWL